MRPGDIADWFVLRRHLLRPWAFVRSRRNPTAAPYLDVSLKDGGVVRMRAEDRRVFHRIFARDEYRLNGLAPGSLGTVVDIGAHIGTFAVRAAGLARRVLCYEPTRESFELLSRNVARFPNVKVHNTAVAGRRGTVTLFLGKNPSRNSLFPPETEPNLGEVTVESFTLEDIFREHAIETCDFLKLDCEGAEYDILYAAPAQLWRRIARVAMEYHLTREPDGRWSGEALARYLHEVGHEPRLYPSKRHPEEGLLFSARR